MKVMLLVVAASLLTTSSSFAADRDDRLQIGIHAQESPLGSQSSEPTIRSVQWSKGDLQVLLTQAAPCGNYIPVNPVWEKTGSTIVLRYSWHAMSEVKSANGDLCLKHVQAWVFRVPNVPYTVLVSDAVPRFARQNVSANAQ